MVILNSPSGRQLIQARMSYFAARDSPNGPSELCDFCAALMECQWERSPTDRISSFFLWKIPCPPATSSDFIRLIAKLDARLRAERKHPGNA